MEEAQDNQVELLTPRQLNVTNHHFVHHFFLAVCPESWQMPVKPFFVCFFGICRLYPDWFWEVWMTKKKGNSIFANRVRTSIRRWFLKCDYNAAPHTVQQQINHRKCFRAAEQNPLRTNVSSRALWFKPCLFFKALYKYIWLWPQSVIIILVIWNQDWSWWCTTFC